MALITCKQCGKKYSDSISACIHCGHKADMPVEESCAAIKETEVVAQDVSVSSVETAQQPKEEHFIQYYDLTLKEQQRLENEYFSLNPKGLKTERMINLIVDIFGLGFSAAIAGIIVAVVWGELLPYMANNYALYDIVLKASIATIVGGLIFGILGFVAVFLFRKTKKCGKYMDEYGSWLKTEKKIII